jgi:nucleoside-diphosphate-sugar epimerase
MCNPTVAIAYSDTMDVLVLGGTHHVGRCVVEAALARGDAVTTITRGVSGPPATGAEPLYADRTDAAELAAAIGDGQWDVAIDTWTGAPRAVKDAAALLVERVPRYVYVSSRSVYRWPIPVGVDETAPVVEADPDSDQRDDYAAAKRGGELAALGAFGERALVARAGLILGPYERVGRLPWWLRRLERGGAVLAPGPQDRPLQYIDGRDLAEWILAATAQGVGGVFNTVSRPGHTTTGELLGVAREVTGSRARLVWVPAATVTAAGVSPWTELPIWVPPDGELAGLHSGDVSAAYGVGLRCRPVTETVSDTWKWLQAEGDPDSLRDGSVGLPARREEEVLTAAGLSTD